MMYEIRTVDSLITGPTIEPLDLDEVKKHLRFAPTTEDTLLDAWISAARQHFEDQTGRQLITATWALWLDAFPCGAIQLPHPPLQTVVDVAYVDGDGVLQSFTDGASPATPYWQVQAPSGPHAARGLVTPIAGQVWPATRCEPGAVRIQYRAGYGAAPGDVPELVQTALYFLVGHFHQFRSEVHEETKGTLARLPIGAQAFIQSFVSRQTIVPRA
jgi:uncharacterized phiE125 gp8 family phage protein